jgi:hypothetical protein
MKNDTSKSMSDIEWEQRTLCRDESCIGVIGPDGRCKECGLPYEGYTHQDVPEDQDVPATDPETAAEEATETVEEDQDFEDDENGAMTDSEWEQRTLCRDESCIGVIGPDGRCKECGLAG